MQGQHSAVELIRYRIRWGWVPLSWTTEITQWEPPYQFVDVQRSGPYQLWRHTHRFQAVEGGTLMTDVVDYALRFGPLGRLMHRLVVKRDLATIFAYRRQRVEELFGRNTVQQQQLQPVSAVPATD
jgi:ligand-binding SRPBCC domain-containing protein